MKIRIAELKDAEILSSLGKETFYDTWKGTASEENLQRFMTESYDVERIKNELNSSLHTYLLLEENETAIGYAKMEETENPPQEIAGYRCLEINKVYLKKDFQEKGLGKLLLDECLKIAVEKNKECVYLGVAEENHRAVRLYKSKGFEAFGRHPFMIGTQMDWDIWMMKKIKKS